MKQKRLTIFRPIGVLVFTLISSLCILFIIITYLSITNFHEASTQLINKDVAAHIATFASPFEHDSINTKKADSVFYNAMVISPSAEVYFLDTTGKIIAYHSPKEALKVSFVPLDEIRKLIASKGKDYIKGTDPKEPGHDKIFSAVEVFGSKHKLGYIYVILGSTSKLSSVLFSNYVGNFLIRIFGLILIISIVIVYVYLIHMERNFKEMLIVLDRFQNGDLDARFKVNENNELFAVTEAFNKMADLLVLNISRLQKSEKERKNFIANISHDLRTPLAIARGYIETLIIKNNPQLLANEQENYVRIALNKITQVDQMVNQLFELSRIESVEFKAAREPFILSEIVQETVKTFELAAAKNNIKLQCSECTNHVWIEADVSMMERVIQNLVSNAVNNTVENGVIEVKLTTENDQLRFEITNPGNPLPGDLLQWINKKSDQHIFTSKWSSRSGVGLLIVKKILQLHGSFLYAITENKNWNVFGFRMTVFKK